MGRRLNTYVHVDDADGVSHAFGPQDDVPAWARKAITNPDAWVDDEDEPASEPAPAASDGDSLSDEDREALEALTEEEQETLRNLTDDEREALAGGDVTQGPPPQGGPGSGRDAWIAYARAKGFDVADDAGRDDIVAQLTEAGIPVE